MSAESAISLGTSKRLEPKPMRSANDTKRVCMAPDVDGCRDSRNFDTATCLGTTFALDFEISYRAKQSCRNFVDARFPRNA